METSHRVLAGLLALAILALAVAFFLYLRTAYRKGGWNAVREDFVVAIVALRSAGAFRIEHDLEREGLRRVLLRWLH
jgi:heme A synthase